MIFNLSVLGDNANEYLEQIKEELKNKNLTYEIQTMEDYIGSGYLNNVDSVVEILKIALGPGILAIICKIVISLKSNIKLKIGENSLEVSSYLSKKEKEILINQFIKDTSIIENSNKTVYGSINITK